MAAGDIACDPSDPHYNGGRGSAGGCQESATAAQLPGVSAVLAGGVVVPDFWTEQMGLVGMFVAGLVYCGVFLLALWVIKVQEFQLLVGWLRRTRDGRRQATG